MHKQLKMQFGNYPGANNQTSFDEFEDAKDDNFYSNHTLVYVKNHDNRKHTSDDLLQDKLDTYFEMNGLKPTDTEFEDTFEECRSLCKNCVFFDKLSIREHSNQWKEHLGNKKDKDFGTCCANPPVIVAVKNADAKDSHKTVLPFVYLNTYCKNFYHRGTDHRGKRQVFGYWGNSSKKKSSSHD